MGCLEREGESVSRQPAVSTLLVVSGEATLLSRQASFSLVVVGSHVTFFSSRVSFPLLSLLVHHPCMLCRMSFLSDIATICLCQCRFIDILAVCCSILATCLPFRLAYVAVMWDAGQITTILLFVTIPCVWRRIFPYMSNNPAMAKLCFQHWLKLTLVPSSYQL